MAGPATQAIGVPSARGLAFAITFLVAVAVSGCAERAPQAADPPTGLAALGLVATTIPFAADGNTFCLPGEATDDTACEPPGGTRLLLGPYDAPILGLNVTATWDAAGQASTELVLTLVCHESGRTDNQPRCDGVPDLVVRGASPLHATLGGLITEPTAIIEVRVEVPDGPAGVAAPTRQAFHLEGVLRSATDPDATNQA